MSVAVQVSGLRKAYPRPRGFRELARGWNRRSYSEALRGVNLSVPSGQVYGILGPNGAGKTTLMKILAGLVLPDEGTVRVQSLDVLTAPRDVKAQIGYVPSDERSFYWRLTGRQNLEFFGRLQGLRSSHLSGRIREVLEMVEMTDKSEVRFDGYSTGMKQRLALARGLLHDPAVLLLDEPTRSLDPSAAHRLRDLLAGRVVNDMGKTVLLATHDLPEAMQLCHAVALLRGGRILAQGAPDAVLDDGLAEAHRLRFAAVDPAGLPLNGLTAEQVGREEWEVRWEAGTLDAEALVRAVLDGGGRLVALEPIRPNLDAVFASLVEAPEEPQHRG